MIYLLIGLLILGGITALAGYFHNRKLEQQLEKGEIDEIPEAHTITTEGCCGAHEVCINSSLLAGVSEKIDYYDDEELDAYQHIPSDGYSDQAIALFEDILFSLKEDEVAPWLRSLTLREIELPDSLRDEALLIVGEKRAVV